ncbi:MAG TPA: endolytic transglycosylase MltG [Burkholderiales bacterium]|nr:endolytic transglycosylase MltG [Burkholderiales bacterium]
MAKRKNLFLPPPKWTLMRLLRTLILFGVFAAAGAACWLAYFALTPVEVASRARHFNIEHGSSLRRVAEQLETEGLISDSWSFLVLARLLGNANDIKAGSYAVGASVTPHGLLDKIVSGDFAQSELRFIEGWTFLQIRHVLDQHPAVKHDSAGLSDAQILERLEVEEKHPEGLFFPDTYHFAAGTSDLTILKQAYLRMRTKLEALWENRAKGLPVSSAYQALILASIVEKETGRADERDMVAAVFVNRLKRGMRLQTDPSVIYGLGTSFDGNLRRRDLETDQIYNTYTRYGLPPTPIAMPGEASIQATLNPANSPVLYFVGRGDGGHEFSSTLAEHNRAVDKYQRAR